MTVQRTIMYILALDLLAACTASINVATLHEMREGGHFSEREIGALRATEEKIQTDQLTQLGARQRSAASEARIRNELRSLDDGIRTLRAEANVASFLSGIYEGDERRVTDLESQHGAQATHNDVVGLDGSIRTLREDLRQVSETSAFTDTETLQVANHDEEKLLQLEDLATSNRIPQTPMYNAVLAPSGPNGQNVMFDHEKTTIRFWIGQPHINGGVPYPKWTVTPEILREEHADALTVTMKCLPCNSDSLQERVLTYSTEQGASSEASFEIVPDRKLATQPDGSSEIAFSVARDGIEYDHVVMTVKIAASRLEPSPIKSAGSDASASPPSPPVIVQENTTTDANTNPPVVASGKVGTIVLGGPPSREPEGSKTADIIFKFSRDLVNAGKLSVTVQPVNSGLRALFRQKHLISGEFRIFETGVLTEQDIKIATDHSYLKLERIVESDNKSIEKIWNSGAQPIPDIQQNITLSIPDRDEILSVFKSIGQEFYTKLFQSNSTQADLWRLMDELDSFTPSTTGEPLRVQIVTNNSISIPWQLLYPSGPGLQGCKFWGLRYELAIVPTLIDGGTSRPVLALTDSSSVMFAGYNDNGETTNNYVAAKARDQRKVIATLVGHEVELYDSRDKFFKALNDNRDSVSFIVAYTHATSGRLTYDNGVPIVTNDDLGPRLLFSSSSWAIPDDLYNLRSQLKLNPDQPAFFSLQPIVFLNACETATINSEDSTGTSLLFPEDILGLGARGFIGTQSRVWAPFAYYFGNDLVAQLFQQVSTPRALLNVRLAYYKERHNPLGLLYAYYGNPDAQIKTQPRLAGAK